MTDLVPAPEPAWSRLHPLTPVLRGGRFVLAAGAVVGQQGLRDASLRTLLIGVAVVVPLGLVVGSVSWWTTRYRLTGTELQVDSGLLQRRSRRVPLARLQSVDVVRSIAARVLGLAELRLEVAGGGKTEAPLAYLTEDAARDLRVRLLQRAPAEGAPVAAEPAEAVLVVVPTGALITSVLLGGPAIITVLLVLAAVPVLVLAPDALPGLLGAVVPLVLGSGGLVVRRVLAEYGFTVAESPDGLRLRHGLLDTRAQTIPYGRVQTVRVSEPLLWRRRGWVRVEVDVAGYAGSRGEERSSTAALLPVAPRAFALALVERVLGGPLPPADRPVPRSARWRAPLSARRLRVGVDGRHLVATSGVLTTTTHVVPLAKAQSLRRTQGPWQRRLGLASLEVDSAGRRLSAVAAPHRAADEADALLAELTDRARLARRQ